MERYGTLEETSRVGLPGPITMNKPFLKILDVYLDRLLIIITNTMGSLLLTGRNLVNPKFTEVGLAMYLPSVGDSQAKSKTKIYTFNRDESSSFFYVVT